ncbi:MAG: phosphoribulokinase [Nitrosomonadales bacterium]|nr:phosphoribulokinase [Nitrosomonadales bacterium]
MSRKHPVIAVTGSSGAGTTTVKRAFENIFRRESISAAVVEGDSLHSLGRLAFRAAAAEAAKAGNHSFSHFGPEANHFAKIEETFKTYGETGQCERRYYIHSDAEAVDLNARYNTNLKPGEFTPWETVGEGSDILFYEGLHGLVKHGDIDASRYVDLGVGVVPIVNLEWIQKIHRDKAERGYSAEATVDTILRRMPDYINYITPQFSRTTVNFQRVSTVDTSNPFIARDIPTPDESFVVVHFSEPKGVDFPYLQNMVPGAFMSRPNTLVVPGGKMNMTLELVLGPMIHDLIENRKK